MEVIAFLRFFNKKNFVSKLKNATFAPKIFPLYTFGVSSINFRYGEMAFKRS